MIMLLLIYSFTARSDFRYYVFRLSLGLGRPFIPSVAEFVFHSMTVNFDLLNLIEM